MDTRFRELGTPYGIFHRYESRSRAPAHHV